MKRSAGVTVIAALALVGSAVTLLMGIVVLLVMTFARIPARLRALSRLRS